MDRRYFGLIDKANDIAILATAIARNANYRDDVDAMTRPFLVFIDEELERCRRVLKEQVSRQMSKDPTERDIDISYAIHDSH